MGQTNCCEADMDNKELIFNFNVRALFTNHRI